MKKYLFINNFRFIVLFILFILLFNLSYCKEKTKINNSRILTTNIITNFGNIQDKLINYFLSFNDKLFGKKGLFKTSPISFLSLIILYLVAWLVPYIIMFYICYFLGYIKILPNASLRIINIFLSIIYIFSCIYTIKIKYLMNIELNLSLLVFIVLCIPMFFYSYMNYKIFSNYINRNRCNKCRKMNSGIKIDEELISKTHDYKTINENNTTIQKPITIKTYCVSYKCKFCEYTWCLFDKFVSSGHEFNT